MTFALGLLVGLGGGFVLGVAAVFLFTWLRGSPL